MFSSPRPLPPAKSALFLRQNSGNQPSNLFTDPTCEIVILILLNQSGTFISRVNLFLINLIFTYSLASFVGLVGLVVSPCWPRSLASSVGLVGLVGFFSWPRRSRSSASLASFVGFVGIVRWLRWPRSLASLASFVGLVRWPR